MATKPTTALPILDHFVILVSQTVLQELPQRLENSLAVIEGGSHADGLTVNKLIILPDGSYIELIAFRDNADPERRKQHRWGSLEEGRIIDWAYTLDDEELFTQVQERVQAASSTNGATYRDPVPGGRLRPDGVELKWAVSSAQDGALKPLWPGTAPFWCLDRTPRHLRVPYLDEATGAAPPYTKQPSGARGVSRVSVTVPEEELSITSQIFDGVHGPAIDDGSSSKAWRWVNHVGSKQGKQLVTLSASSSGERKIGLTLLGNGGSPRSIQVLPGLEFYFDTE